MKMLSNPGPPHISFAFPLQAVEQPEVACLDIDSELPQKHCPPFSVPAIEKPLSEQYFAHPDEVMAWPHQAYSIPVRDRGLTLSV